MYVYVYVYVYMYVYVCVVFDTGILKLIQFWQRKFKYLYKMNIFVLIFQCLSDSLELIFRVQNSDFTKLFELLIPLSVSW